jgi:elongator complex protein 3 (tRNA carboxymethyluridine synthase)
MRSALSLGFDPCLQVRRSLSKYAGNGHEVGKVEAIIEGGTFLATPLAYQEGFVKGVFDGLNHAVSPTLEEAQLLNESSRSRCVGLSVESKPDWCSPRDIDLLLRYGVTRLEIGVQSLHDPILRRSNRGHTVAETLEAFRVARDAGLKVTAHMMPGLPGADPRTDLADLKRIFEDEELRPDMTKIYPTLVVPGTSLARQQEAGLYEPYDLETVVELLSEMKRDVPPWHRIMRIQREIPSHEISGGVRNGNLRQLVLQRVAEKGFRCRCIRCREVALNDPDALDGDERLRYQELRYSASSGSEVFGSYEYERSGLIAGFFRMRLPSDRAHRRELASAAVVRELRVYGPAVGVGRRNLKAWQHRGLGAVLMHRAEGIAGVDLGVNDLLVISAVGTRNYYRRLGYERMGPYMAKSLKRAS